MAAGSSKRFGDQDKRFALLHSGKTILETSLENIQQAKLPFQIAIASNDADLEFFNEWQDHLIHLNNTELGLGHNIAQALSLIEKSADYHSVTHFMICLADMPYIQTETYRLLAESTDFFPRQACVLLSPEHQFLSKQEQIQKAGNPVLISREWLDEFTQLYGDKGGKAKLLACPEKVEVLLCSDPGIYKDIDKPKDLY